MSSHAPDKITLWILSIYIYFRDINIFTLMLKISDGINKTDKFQMHEEEFDDTKGVIRIRKSDNTMN